MNRVIKDIIKRSLLLLTIVLFIRYLFPIIFSLVGFALQWPTIRSYRTIEIQYPEYNRRFYVTLIKDKGLVFGKYLRNNYIVHFETMPAKELRKESNTISFIGDGFSYCFIPPDTLLFRGDVINKPIINEDTDFHITVSDVKTDALSLEDELMRRATISSTSFDNVNSWRTMIALP